MAKRALISKEDFGALPETDRADYAPVKDGRHAGMYSFQLEAVDGWANEDVRGLRASLEASREDARAARATAAKLVDAEGRPLEPERVLEALAYQEKFKDLKGSEKDREQFAERERESQRKFNRDKEQFEKQIAEQEKEIHRLTVDNEGERIMAAHGGGSWSMLKAAMPDIIKVEKREDGTRIPRIYSKTGAKRISTKSGSTDDMTLEELVLSTKDHPELSRAWDGSGSSGGGATGTGQNGAKKTVVDSKLQGVEKLKAIRRSQQPTV